jgi:hypothetical protein
MQVRQNHSPGDQPWMCPGVLAKLGKARVYGRVCLAGTDQTAMACWVVECFSSWSAW